ncbi:TPA: hypothetical protein HA251_00260 [Candidatus Woesearchaeota archaeon]|nr:hypothetical protein [Candidatus Woesearchaeota archaeon]
MTRAISNKILRKELSELTTLMRKSKTSIHSDHLVGMYYHWAKIESIDKNLRKKGIVSTNDIEKEMIPFIRAMKKDFRKK